MKCMMAKVYDSADLFVTFLKQSPESTSSTFCSVTSFAVFWALSQAFVYLLYRGWENAF